MAKKKGTLGAAKRFGARYGRKLREKVALIESEKRKSTKCPYCNYDKVKRLARGIWHCKKCSSTFTGKAYTIKAEIRFEKKGAKAEEELSRKRLRAGEKREDIEETKKRAEKTKEKKKSKEEE